MKQFIDKLIERLEEKFKYNSEQAEIWRSGSDKDAYFRGQKDLYMDRANTYGEVMRIVNQLAEEYKDDIQTIDVSELLGESEQVKQTNADRLRAMSDEELAEFLINFKNTFGEEYEGEMSCIEWLQSEVEEPHE